MATGSYKAQPIIPFDNSIYERGTESLKEGITETFKKGSPVIIDADGFVNKYAGGGTVYGIAAEDAHNGAADGTYEVLVHRAIPGERWLVTYQDAIDQTDIGDTFGLVEDGATGTWYLDEADVTDEMVVVGIPQGPGGTAIGDTIKYVYAAFLQTTVQSF